MVLSDQKDTGYLFNLFMDILGFLAILLMNSGVSLSFQSVGE